MSDVFDIQPVVEAIMGSTPLVATEGPPPGKKRFDAEDSNGMFIGDVSSGLTLMGQRSLLVQGSLNGTGSNPCQVEVEGDVVVTGNVGHARIHCQHLHVGGAVHHARLVTAGDIIIGADLVHTHLLVGDYEARQGRINELQQELVRGRERRVTLDRRIGQEEKRLDRTCKTTHVPLNLDVSRLIAQEQDRIRIDLSTFYQAMGDQPETKLRMALTEFFAKGIIGYLAKANRRYIIDHPAREKVFLQLLKNLRELIMLVFQRDRLIVAVNRAEDEMEQLVAEVRQQIRSVHIQGAVQPETEVEFALPLVQRLEEGEWNLAHRSVSLKIQSASQPGQLRLHVTDVDGKPVSRDLSADELQCVLLSTSEGHPVWESALAAEENT